MPSGAGASPGRLLRRHRVRRWAAIAGAVRVWVLQAGPGSGKSATARLLAEALGMPIFSLDPCRDDPSRMAPWRDLPSGATPERMAEAVLERAARAAPAGATFVASWPGPQDRNGLAGEAFMSRWLAISGDRFRTIVKTCSEPPWLSPRLLAGGEAMLLGAPDLWFDPEEEARLLHGVSVPTEAVRATRGWPLGLVSLSRLAGKAGLLPFLEDLAATELWESLPEELRTAALELWPLSVLRPEEEPLEDSRLGRVRDSLVRWGLLVPEGKGTLAWHPLARAAIGQAYDTSLDPEERRRRIEEAGCWLEQRDAGRAYDFWLSRGDHERAIACLVSHGGRVPVSAGQDREIAAWLGRLPDRVRDADPRVLLVEGALLLRQGAHADARERLESARAAFHDQGNPAGEFAALGGLLEVCLQREDVPAGRAIVAVAEGLAARADLGDRVVYEVNRGTLEILGGHEDAAMRHYRRALDFPHLGRPRVALARAEACLNLATMAYERGEFGQARRILERAMREHDDLGVDPVLPARAGVLLALVRLAQGEHREGVVALEAARRASRPCESQRLASFYRMEGQAWLWLRRHDEADRALRQALEVLHQQGLERSGQAASTLASLGELSRRKGEYEAAETLFSWAEPLAGGLTRLRATIRLGKALIARSRGEIGIARALLEEALEDLEGVVARPLKASVALVAAALASKAGDSPARERYLAVGTRCLREGPYYYVPISLREVAPEIWVLLAEGGCRDFLEGVATRFPRAAQAIAAEANGGIQVGRAMPSRIEIRSFGQIQVRVGSESVTFSRRKARVLLAHLLLAPSGLSRDEAAEMLYPDLDWEEARHQVDNLTSLLRRALSPGGKARGASSVLVREGGRYRLDHSALWWDAKAFEQAYEAGDRAWNGGDPDRAVALFAEALDLYVDDLFAGPELAEWFEAARQAFRSRAIGMLARSAEYHLARERFEPARMSAERILALEPAHEGAHRLLMRLYARLGEAGLVRRQFDLCARSLAQHLDVEPSVETRALLVDLLHQAECPTGETGP